MIKDGKTFTDWLNETINTPARESPGGYHFISTLMQDPYSFYLRYVRGLRPVKTKPALIKGGIIHSAIEAAYRYGKDAALNTVKALFAARADEYEDREQHTKDWQTAEVMITAWCDKWLEENKKLYHVLHLEEEFTLPLANGYTLTVRPDIVLQSKTDAEIRGRDHKTTGYNLMTAHNNFADSDQPTTYIWALKKLYPNNRILGVESDIIFKRDNMREAKCEHVGIVQRSDWYLAQWEISTIAWLQDIARRVELLKDGYPAAYAFPRGQNYWGSSDWPDIYRAPLPEDESEPPYGYVIDNWQRERITSTIKMQEDQDNATET